MPFHCIWMLVVLMILWYPLVWGASTQMVGGAEKQQEQDLDSLFEQKKGEIAPAQQEEEPLRERNEIESDFEPKQGEAMPVQEKSSPAVEQERDLAPAPKDIEQERLTDTDFEKPFGEEEKSPFSYSGKIWNKLAHDLRKDNSFEDQYYNHLEVQFGTKYALSQTIQFVLALRANYFAFGNGEDLHHDGDVRLYNAYVNLAFSDINLRVGNQIVTWGKADEVSPLDNINPEDLRDGFTRRRGERKLPIPMVNLELSRDVYKLQALYIPFFECSKIDISGSDWALFDHIDQLVGRFDVTEDKPAKRLKNGEVGLRFAGKVRALDYAFSYLYTWQDLPSPAAITFQSTLPFTAQARLAHPRQHIFGGELETVVESFGLRGDVAYVDKRGFLAKNLQTVTKPVFEYVVGIDYNGPNNFYTNFQFSQSLIQDYDKSILFFDELTTGINGQVSKEFFNNNLKLVLRYFYIINNNSFYLNPYIVWQYWQNVYIELGVDYIDGPRDTTLGFFRDNTQGYAIVRLSF